MQDRLKAKHLRTRPDLEPIVSTGQPFNDADVYLCFDRHWSIKHACDLGVSCPSRAGQQQHLVVMDLISNEVKSNTDGNYSIALLGAGGTQLFCLQFPARIL